MSKVSMKVYTAEENKNIDAKKYRKQKMKFIIQHLWLKITMCPNQIYENRCQTPTSQRPRPRGR